MKKISLRIVSLLLALCMLFPFASVGTFAVEEPAKPTVSFKFEKLEETNEAVSLKLSLTEGKLLCFDFELKADAEAFECTDITFSDEIKGFFNENSDGHLVANCETNIISVVNTVELSEAMGIATFTFKKLTTSEITADDFEPSFTACYQQGEDGNEVEAECIIENTLVQKHTHTEKTEHKDPSCTEDGFDKTYCSDCGDVISNTVLPKLNHNKTHKDTKLASCTEDGYINTVCDLCGDIIDTKTLEHKGHKYIKDVKNAACTEDGYIKIVCSACQDVGSQTVIAHAGHAWGEYKIVKHPTYSTKGLERSVCSNCGDFLERDIPKLVKAAEEIVIVPEKDFVMNYQAKDRLQATVFPEEAAYSVEIVWKSTNPDVVSVDESGNIVAKKVGAATIIASTADGTVKASRRITVQYSTLQWIIVYLLFGWLWYI